MKDALVVWGIERAGITEKRSVIIHDEKEAYAKRERLVQQYGETLKFCVVRIIGDAKRFKEKARLRKKASGWIRWKTQAGSLISIAHNAAPGRNTLCGLAVPKDLTRIQKDVTSKRCEFCTRREARNQRRKASREAYSPPRKAAAGSE